MSENTNVRVHSLAILKGAVEGDDTKHLGSLMGMDGHAVPLLRAGLVVDLDGQYVPTETGKRFYTEHALSALPDGRANYWTGDALVATEQALRTLEGH